MVKNSNIAKHVLEAVGGSDNVTSVIHCVTRLRFTLKDLSKVDEEGLKKTEGVIGYQNVGGQIQVVIGPNVDKVYSEICRIGNIDESEKLNENLDPKLMGEKKQLTPKNIGGMVLNYLSNTMLKVVPVLLVAGLFKAVNALGADFFGWYAADSDLYKLFEIVYNAAFYFLPIYIGYEGVKYCGGTGIFGAFLGAIMIAPGFLELTGLPFSVYGIPAVTYNYTSTVFPMILIAPAFAFFEKLFDRVLPNSLKFIGNFLAVAVMLPIGLCLLAPLGGWINNSIASLITLLSSSDSVLVNVIVIVVLSAFLEFTVMTGMHTPIILIGVTFLMTNGYDPIIIPAFTIATFACWGIALGAAIKTKSKKDRATFFGYLIANMIGGVTEPTLFGVGLRYKRTLIAMIIGGALGGLVIALTGFKTYAIPGTNILILPAALAGGTENFVSALFGFIVSFFGSAAAVQVLGLEKKTK